MNYLELIINSFGIGIFLLCLPIILFSTTFLLLEIFANFEFKDGICATMLTVSTDIVFGFALIKGIANLSSIVDGAADIVLASVIVIGTIILGILSYILYSKIYDVKIKKKQAVKNN